ncbi:hypothetical protein ACFYZ2_18435 [Streptomyces sviceus]|uniref:hypothetical protein n=1 Tax=Streptomyces sviceus TaxID=285530 RepID=UPI0036B15BB4
MELRELEDFLAVVDSGAFYSALAPAVAAMPILRPEDRDNDGHLAAFPVGSREPVRWSTTGAASEGARAPLTG